MYRIAKQIGIISVLYPATKENKSIIHFIAAVN